MTTRGTLLTIIAVSAALRLTLAATLPPTNDEAYYARFVAHPDWSYFDHPPMVALVAAVGPALAGWPPSIVALRLGFVALFAGSTALMARLAGRLLGPSAAVPAALALNATLYYGAAAGTGALPDGPLTFFWLLTLDRLAAALEACPGRLRPWVGVGLAWGGAMLSKYQAVFLPTGVLLFFLWEPTARRRLRTPGPYLAAGIGLIVFAPVVVWNARHGWASFAFQGGRALGGGAPRPDLLAVALLGQAAYLLPWIWLGLLIAGVRRWRSSRPADRFLLAQAAPPLAVLTAIAAFRPVLPHWGLVGFLPLIPLLGADWAARLRADPRRTRRRLAVVAILPAAIVATIVGHARSGLLQRPGRGALGLIAPVGDPSIDLATWGPIARELDRRGLLGRPGTFLFTGNWAQSAQLAFAIGGAMPVLCYHGGDARGFASWSRPEDWVGRDGVLVALDDRNAEPGCFEPYFARVEPLGAFPIARAGAPVRPVRLFLCTRQIRPFPFDGRPARRGGPVLLSD